MPEFSEKLLKTSTQFSLDLSQQDSYFEKEENINKYELFQPVALAHDFPEKDLRRGDVATIVDCHPASDDGEVGYSLEVFSANNKTREVIVVAESEILPLQVKVKSLTPEEKEKSMAISEKVRAAYEAKGISEEECLADFEKFRDRLYQERIKGKPVETHT